MKRITKILALLLALVLFLDIAGTPAVQAAEAAAKALDPASQVELSVPDALGDGGSYFFIREDHTVREDSTEKLYIPIQRTGDLSEEADITLKLVDMTAHFGVNYDAEIYRADAAPSVEYGGVALVDAFLNAQSIEEVDPDELTGEAAQAVYDAGGADFVGADGAVLGTLTTVPTDEDGNPVDVRPQASEEAPEAAAEAPEAAPEAPAEAAEAPEAPAEAAAGAPEAAEAPAADGEMSLKEARDAYTGTVSDRQQLAGGSLDALMPVQEAVSGALENQAGENYPGREYALHFKPGEEALFLVITPKYSEAADGDSTIMLLLKDQPEGWTVPEDFNMRSVLILDTDEPAPAVISFAETEIRAEDGTAAIRVTRQGRVNALVGVYLTSNDGTAVQGDDYSGVGANLWFPMGITERTVELPVGHGTQEKDFYVYLSPVSGASDVEIGADTARVVIPAAGPGSALLADEDEDRLADPLNIRDRKWYWSAKEKDLRDNDEGFSLRSKNDDDDHDIWVQLHPPEGYAYDGYHVDYDIFTNWCKARVFLEDNQSGAWTETYRKDHGDCSYKTGLTIEALYKNAKAPNEILVGARNYSNKWASFSDCYVQFWVHAVRPIKRKFTVQLLTPEALEFQGMTPSQVLANYQQTILDDSLGTMATYQTGDHFSVSRLGAQEWARLTGLVAVASDGRTMSIGTLDGKNSSMDVQLSEELINALAGGGFITWKENDGSYSGSIKIRPVYDYVQEITVKVRDSGYGGLALKTAPTLLWDFNADGAMSASMGAARKNLIEYEGGRDADGNEFYTFTATGGEPFVSMDTPVSSVYDIQWVKVRARNLCGAKVIELFACRENNTNVNGNTCTHIPLEQDTEWHEYLINIPEANVKTANAIKNANLTSTAWTGNINWIRLDAMGDENGAGMKNGDKIQIDYVAFYKTKEDAENGFGSPLAPGTHTFHYGDKLTFKAYSTAASIAEGLRPVGMGYQSRMTGPAGVLTGQTECAYYIPSENPYRDDAPTFVLTQDYYEFWQVFSGEDNTVRLRVAEEDLQYLDTSKGVFSGLRAETADGGYVYYTVKAGVLTNEFTGMTAVVKDGTHVPVWTLPNDKTVYSGDTFWFFAGVRAPDNVVTLGVDRDADSHAYYTFSGVTYTSTLNLSTAHGASDMIPVRNAVITAPQGGTMSMADGDFSLSAQYLAGGTTMRYLIGYNGQTDIREVRLAPADAPKAPAFHEGRDGAADTVQAVPVSLGDVEVNTWTPGGARFSNLTVSLGGFNTSAISAMELNGKKLEVSLTVDPGAGYLAEDSDGNTVTVPENVVDVKLYFQNSLTGEIHGEYSVKAEQEKFRLAWDAATNTATLTIREFSPDAPEFYTYGDVLMAELVTDRRTGSNAYKDWDMVYQPVSTGFMVIADQDYVPKTFNYDVNIAEMLDSSIEGVQEDGQRRASFGQFPWLGEITAVVKVFATYSSVTKYNEAEEIIEDLEEMGEYGQMEDDGELMETAFAKRRWAMSALVLMKDTYYNGLRIMIGVAVRSGNSKYQRRANPYQSQKSMYNYLRGGEEAGFKTGELIFDSSTQNTKQQNNNVVDSEFGGGYFTFGVYVGFYLDFGYIEIMDEDGDGYHCSHDAVFMGAGGFVGAMLTAGYTAYIFPYGVPIFVNLEAYLNITVFLGSSGDPNKTLEESYYNNNQHTGNDWDFNLEVDGQAGIRGTLGVGFFKTLAVRGTVGLGLRAGYSLRMKDWYPNLTGADTLSYSTDCMFSGGIDTPFGSYDLWSASWPAPWGYGWLQYFQQMTRANNLIHFMKQNIDEGYCPDRYIKDAQVRIDELAEYVDAYSGDGPSLRREVNYLKNWASDHHCLGDTEARRVDAIRMGGIVGNIMEAVMLTGDAGETTQNFHVNDHVDSEWVAGEDASLMAAFGPVESRKLVDNAVSQPGSQIIALGGNRFLVVFLDDDPARERQQAQTLRYTVYDAGAGTWTAPVTLQDDGTGDSQASLADAGEQVVITWSSVAPEKLQALKDEVAEEYKKKFGTAPGEGQIETELEADPARLLLQMDVFTVRVDKRSGTPGPIEQLTDDEFYDAGAQAVCDPETGDCIVLYTKTYQESDGYASAGERFENMISGNPDDKTYSVLAYMLYNNQPDAKDTRGRTHEPGWARDYYFPNETDEDLASQDYWLEQWGGQRFLNSALREEDGGQSDMPISDMTVAPGYNGLAAFSFTVDKDYDLDTGDDRDLFVQFYRFSDHSIYVPVKVAGEAERYVIDRGTAEVTGTAMEEVSVSQPRLIRSGGSTMLFWRQADEGLYYLNISDMLNAVVTTADGETADESNTAYAVQADGTFAFDVKTGKPYQPEIQRVDFGAALTDGKLTATDYQVITDQDDNLYVVWNDSGVYQKEVDDGFYVTHPTLGIYATALIREEHAEIRNEDGTPAVTASWSKPFLLTRDHTSNDGIAIALDESDGSLIVVHNQYEMRYAYSEEEQLRMVEKGQAGIQVAEEDGEEKAYFLGDPFYPSEISLMVTRFAPVGSVEATQFVFSDETPTAGQTVRVAAAIENTGLTTAEGCDIRIYECVNGVRGKEIYSLTSDARMPVNTAKKVTFDWTVPSGGPAGCTLQAVVREKKTGGGWYDAIENESEALKVQPEYEPELEQCVQNGDGFDVRFRVKNTGNAPAPEGTTVNLFLQALHGDLKERYGMDDDTLIREDISGLAPGETRIVIRTITIPVSVFRYCGYDAVAVSVMDENEDMLATTDQELITLDAPVNLKLNGGRTLNVEAGKKAKAVLDYESTVFIDTGGGVLYSVDNPAIASVDAEGNITGLARGITTLTATMLPSGRKTSVKVNVGGECRKDESCPISKFTDSKPTAWYHDGVHWALDNGVMNGVSETKFSPNTPTSRAMIVTMLYRMEGEPEVGKQAGFRDVPAGKFYTDAVNWAFEHEIVNGYSATAFGPNDDLTREQLVTILERFAKYRGMDVSKGEAAYLTGYTDADKISNYAVKAFRWAVDAGIIQGMTETTLSPKTSATRAQVATMLMRFDGLT